MAEAADIDGQDAHYLRAAAQFGPAIERLARGYEADAELRRDLLQEMHAALWRSFAHHDGRCSERTWVYRVTHNVGADHVRTRRRLKPEVLIDLDEAASLPAADDLEGETGARRLIERLTALIRGLKPADRQVMLLYLEDLSAAEIADITGLSAGAVAVRIHRAKALLSERFAMEFPA